jgi:hypothetical protein
MRMVRRELLRLWRCVTERPGWELGLAVVVSMWTFAWILAQAQPDRPSPLDVLAGAVEWAGIPAGWLTAAGDWFTHGARRGVLFGVAVIAGLLWAATTERAQWPALAGWFAVLAAAEGLGYQSAVNLAVFSLAAFVGVLALVALPGKASFALDRVVLVPRDVLRAGATAAALAAMVPLLAPGLLLVRLFQPYVTRPPRPASHTARRPALPRPRTDSPEAREDTRA